MTKKIIYQGSFLVSGIMCHQGCGVTVQNCLSDLNDLKKRHLLPDDAEITIDAEPQSFGVHRLFISIESSNQQWLEQKTEDEALACEFKKCLDAVGFEVVADSESMSSPQSHYVNWINIMVNLLSIATISLLTTLFPPSLFLTIGLTTFSFLTTAFTARSYLINFFHNLRNKNLMNMATPITLGWGLSLAHALYHSILMPLTHQFSMIFMNLIMPVALITIINVMDEIKRLVFNKSKKMILKGLNALFPEMANTYSCYELSSLQTEQLLNRLNGSVRVDNVRPISIIDIGNDVVVRNKKTLKKGMIILVKCGECFPVDGIIIQGSTCVDTAILTGESQQLKQCFDAVPAGAINRGHDVIIYATADCYNSTVNKLLFRANREGEKSVHADYQVMLNYGYVGVMATGIAASVLLPWAFGIFTVPLVLQNIVGILFAICPCTTVIADQLPQLLSIYQRSNKGIIIRNENLTTNFNNIHTVVFDKTGTLTTGVSEVESSDISSSLWQRIYLLEKHLGDGHPLANAINSHYEKKIAAPIIFSDIKDACKDPLHRGLTGIVQNIEIHLGNADFLKQAGVNLPNAFSADIQDKLRKGYTPVYVAENREYKGVILIKHQMKPSIYNTLVRLKAAGIKLIMLTGDSKLAANGFNHQYGAIFEPENIHAEQTPEDKEQFLTALFATKGIDPKGIWFVGDGLNDAPSARVVTEKGGVSCAMTSNDKASFFTDISLNGSLDYLFEHNQLNQFLKKNRFQNQWVMIYSSIVFLAFIPAASFAGIAVSPFIFMGIMASTTLLVLFNSYRVQLSVDNALDKKNQVLKKIMASDLSLAWLLTAGALFIVGALISIMATGPILSVIASTCCIVGGVMFSASVLLGIGHVIEDFLHDNASDVIDLENRQATDFRHGEHREATRHSVPPARICPVAPLSPDLSPPSRLTSDGDADIASVFYGVRFAHA